jgi:hypothetical protein
LDRGDRLDVLDRLGLRSGGSRSTDASPLSASGLGIGPQRG